MVGLHLFMLLMNFTKLSSPCVQIAKISSIYNITSQGTDKYIFFGFLFPPCHGVHNMHDIPDAKHNSSTESAGTELSEDVEVCLHDTKH